MMSKKLILALTTMIVVLAIFASGSGLFWKDLYINDTKSGSSQEIGSDLVTLTICVPLLIISAFYTIKGNLRGYLIWIGSIFFFLYTYASMSFLSAYNQLFLVYVALFSISAFTFVGNLVTIDPEGVKASISPKAPVKVVAVFVILVGALLSLMWLSLILGALIAGVRPSMLESYTTLVIQALDLGVVAPLCFLTGYLLLKGRGWGYVLASLVLVKGSTLGTAILSMALFMWLNGVEISLIQVGLFSAMTICSAVLAALFYRGMRSTSNVSAKMNLS